jgi:archaellum component FlaC
MDDNDRMKKFENALDPAVTKFMPKKPVEPTISSLIEQIRTHIKSLNELCDEVDRMITASEDSARKAADSLMDMLKKVK